PDHPLNIRSNDWPIYSKNIVSPPQLLTEEADVTESMVCDGAFIRGQVNRSVISQDVKIGKDSQVEKSILMTGARVGQNAVIKYAILGEGAQIADNAQVIGT
ncbi:glucose-1-phosphate adenylyltransferase, partial [Aerococcus sp. UMB9870]|nr:glucose-1-phosphate adenylyltransferase [Aerococcus sp. UMB9870]